MSGSAAVPTQSLPLGQHAITDFPRFGLPAFMNRWPEIPSRPVLKVLGEVQRPCEVALADLDELPRHEQTSDFHCVTTWSRLGLRWGGYRLRDVYERLIVPRTKPDPEARWLVITGLDGYRASLLLEDALASDVLLADRLDGEELSIEHGAPIRVVAPGHYGYKSVRHVSGLELRKHCPKSVAGSREHSRGRVALEERGEMLPGWLWRGIWRAMLPATFWYYRRLRAEAVGARRAAALRAGRRRQLLVFLHGFPQFWYAWRHRLRQFSADHLAVAADLRGYNPSSKPKRRQRFAMSLLVEDLRALVGHLGLERFVLSGAARHRFAWRPVRSIEGAATLRRLPRKRVDWRLRRRVARRRGRVPPAEVAAR